MDDCGDLHGKVALVLGSTAGVGLRTAERLARGGAHVMLNGRSAARGAEALAGLRATGADCDFAAGDLTDPAALQEVIDAAQTRFGGIDMLVSAGAESRIGVRPFSEIAPEDIGPGLLDRFLPRILPVRLALPALKARGAGSVVLLTSDAARHPTPGESIVGAAAAGVLLATKVLARELSRDRIRVNAVAMTITSDTPTWDRIFSGDDFTRKLFEKAVGRFPSGAAPTASEVAEVAAFLASPASGQVTGQTISVNGGLSFGGW